LFCFCFDSYVRRTRMLSCSWSKWLKKVEDAVVTMRKERMACLHCYKARLFSILRVMMTHVVHRRVKANHYAKLHAEVCAVVLLPIAMKRLTANCRVSCTIA
jgi:hypothetical protein